MVRSLALVFAVTMALGLQPGQVQIETRGLAKTVRGEIQPAEPLPSGWSARFESKIK